MNPIHLWKTLDSVKFGTEITMLKEIQRSLKFRLFFSPVHGRRLKELKRDVIFYKKEIICLPKVRIISSLWFPFWQIKFLVAALPKSFTF